MRPRPPDARLSRGGRRVWSTSGRTRGPRSTASCRTRGAREPRWTAASRGRRAPLAFADALDSSRCRPMGCGRWDRSGWRRLTAAAGGIENHNNLAQTINVTAERRPRHRLRARHRPVVVVVPLPWRYPRRCVISRPRRRPPAITASPSRAPAVPLPPYAAPAPAPAAPRQHPATREAALPPRLCALWAASALRRSAPQGGSVDRVTLPGSVNHRRAISSARRRKRRATPSRFRGQHPAGRDRPVALAGGAATALATGVFMFCSADAPAVVVAPTMEALRGGRRAVLRGRLAR